MTVDVEAEQLLIGTTVGGDTGSLSELETWIKTTLQPKVDAAGSRLGEIVGKVPDVWSDGIADDFIGMLEQGRNDTNELADRLEKVASLIGTCGPAITETQSNLQGVADNGVKDQFEVTEEGIWYPENPGLWDYGGNPAGMWMDLERQADDAISPLASQMELMAKGGIWTSVLFTGGSIVSQTTEDLLQRYEAGQGLSFEIGSQHLGAPLLDTLEPRQIGLLKLATKVGGPVIDGLQMGYGLYQGKRPDQVIIEFGVGVGLLTGAGHLGSASVSYLIAGSFAPALGLAAVAAVAVYAAIVVPSEIGDYYVRNVAMDSRSRIVQSGGESPYDESDDIVWDKGRYEHD